MEQDLLAALGLAPSSVPALPAKARNTLVAYLIRWEYNDAARRCLQQLLVTHSRMVSLYDKLALVYLAQGQPERALEIVRRRQALKTSTISRAVEARVLLDAGDVATARSIAHELVSEHRHMVNTWRLQTHVCLATGDLDGAEAALEEWGRLRPEAAETAQNLALLWQARGDAVKALLWARTALSRIERDRRQPPVELLRLMEKLYRATGQPAQAGATAAHLRKRKKEELEQLKSDLALAGPSAGSASRPPAPSTPAQLPTTVVTVETTTGVIKGAVEISAEEQQKLDQALRRDFAHDVFRPGQADVIAAVLRGQSVLAVMPTGAGKSLCYQMAAMELPGTTLVISPLIALMKDQLDGLPAALAAKATALNSLLDGSELLARLERAAAGGYKLLYAAPERLRQRPFLHAMARAGVSLLVVDEAHCVSLWGHDFRPDYRFIAKAWRELGRPPILGMTATATPRVRDDIGGALGQMHLIATDVLRPNLYLAARRFASEKQKSEALLALCKEIKGSGIVYASSRHKCEELALMLRKNRVKAIHYHAGIQDRAAAQDRFMNGQARVVVATIAFGMGVDKSDVRFIIHYNPPRTLENYYQEAGRAGRDGLPAQCILFHSTRDKARSTWWLQQDALERAFLRDLYTALEQRLGAGGTGLVALADLERDLATDDTQVRVAVHFLETAGLLQRDFDLPRSSSITLYQPSRGEEPEFARFVEAARLRPGQSVDRDLLALSSESGLDPREIEARVLAWQDAGWLRYRGTGRDMLLSLPPAPADSRQRVAAMLADYRAGQEGRLAEIMAYARTQSCRHGTISAYFGGRAIERCQSCDNCLGTATRGRLRPGRAVRRSVAVVEQDQSPLVEAAVLAAIDQLPYPMGRTGVARALQGAGSSPVKADRFPLFGALDGWTQVAIQDLIGQMEEAGLLAAYEKGRYRLLRLTEEGHARLKAQPEVSGTLPPLAPPPPTRPPGRRAQEIPGIPPPAETPGEIDQALFERLRAWRWATASAMDKPPYVVFPDSTLKLIASRRPANLEELAAIKGVGPSRLEQYGQHVLAILSGRE